MMRLKVIVSALNANGEPDFYYCIVKCSFEEYNNADHTELAERMALDQGYEPVLAFDENDVAGKAILDNFNWDEAPEFTV